MPIVSIRKVPCSVGRTGLCYRYDVTYNNQVYGISATRERNDAKMCKALLDSVAWANGGYCEAALFEVPNPRANHLRIDVTPWLV